MPEQMNAARVRELAEILGNERGDTRLRTLSAAELGRIPGDAAVRALEGGLAATAPTVLLVVLRALGWRGDAATMPELAAVARRASGAVARQARYAEALIAHRLNLDTGPAMRPPEEEPPLAMPSEVSTLRMGAAAPAEVAAAVKALGEVGMPLSKELGLTLACEMAEGLVLLHEDLARPGGVAALAGRRAVPAILAVRNHESGEYRISLTVLSSPGATPDRLILAVCDAGGRVPYAGEAQLGAEGLRATVQTVRGSNAPPLHIEVGFDGQSLSVHRAVTAASAPSRRRTPTAWSRPG
jgi:hypothetical protein